MARQIYAFVHVEHRLSTTCGWFGIINRDTIYRKCHLLNIDLMMLSISHIVPTVVVVVLVWFGLGCFLLFFVVVVVFCLGLGSAGDVQDRVFLYYSSG